MWKDDLLGIKRDPVKKEEKKEKKEESEDEKKKGKKDKKKGKKDSESESEDDKKGKKGKKDKKKGKKDSDSESEDDKKGKKGKKNDKKDNKKGGDNKAKAKGGDKKKSGSDLVLYNNNYSNNVSAFVSVIAAIQGIEVEEVIVNESNKDKLIHKFPNSKFPFLETPEGLLFEGNAIAKHLAKLNPTTGLCGSTLIESAQVDQWLDWLHDIHDKLKKAVIPVI